LPAIGIDFRRRRDKLLGRPPSNEFDHGDWQWRSRGETLMRLVRVLAPILTKPRGWPGHRRMLLVAWGLVALPYGASAAPPPVSFAEIVERVAPAVVNISTTKAVPQGEMPNFPFPEPPPGSPFEDFFREFFDRDQMPEVPRRQSSLGSGFVVDSEGFVVTNNHVIAEADQIQVVFSDERTYEATLRPISPCSRSRGISRSRP
jgi:serine protease Do